MKQYSFHLIILSILLGIVGGIFFPEKMLSLSWIGHIFINLLKLIVLPLIFCALVSAISAISLTKLGSIGQYTLAYILTSVSIAVLIGLVLINLFKPGINIDPKLILSGQALEIAPIAPFSQYIQTLFPANIIAAAVKYDIMPIVFFSIVFAIACLAVGKAAQIVIDLFSALRDVLVKMIVWLMYLTPIGLFSLLGAAVAEASLANLLVQSIRSMSVFILLFLTGLSLQFIWQLFVLTYIAGKNPRAFLTAAGRVMVTAFATSSSMATLPTTLIMAKEQHISDETARFVLPLATTINLSGTAMYEAVSALFFCQILGIDLSIPAQIGVFLVAILAGMGATGIPEGGLVTMVMVLRNVNVPTSAIGLLLPFDRILDRFRTMTNVWGDLVCAATVDYFQQKQKTRTP